MTSAPETLPNCDYRTTSKGTHRCTVNRGKETSELHPTACNGCKVPKLLSANPCTNLTLNTFLARTGAGGVPIDVEYTCRAGVMLENLDRCSEACDFWDPIAPPIDLYTAPTILHSETAMGVKELRQAMLAALYRYMHQHPHRRNRPELPPEYLAKVVGARDIDIIPALYLLEEQGLVRLKERPGRNTIIGACITADGIKAIDDDPLFGRVRTGDLNIENFSLHVRDGNVINMGNSGPVSTTVTLDTSEKNLLINPLFEHLERALPDHREAVEEFRQEATRPTPDKSSIVEKAKNLLAAAGHVANMQTLVGLICKLIGFDLPAN